MGKIISYLRQLRTAGFFEKCLAACFLASFFLYEFLQENALYEPQSPDEPSGHLVPHAVKGATVYVTAIQDFLLTLSYYTAVACFVLLAIRSYFAKTK